MILRKQQKSQNGSLELSFRILTFLLPPQRINSSSPFPMRILSLTLFVGTFTILLSSVYGQLCPNLCSGHGQCSGDAQLRCQCHEGWYGNDCSLRECPKAGAWIGYTKESDNVHSIPVECSRMGTCDRNSGKCSCFPGFIGAACEKLTCPGSPTCGEFGRCITLRQAGLGYDGIRLVNPSVNYNQWDSDRIYGCLCDYGYTGYDCTLKQCPKGDDPVTPGVPEIQTITCTCSSGFCQDGGYFTVTFGGRTTRVLHNAVATIAQESSLSLTGSGSARGESVESRLQALIDVPTFSSVEYAWGTEACGPNNQIKVTFLNSAGNVPPLVVTSGSLKDITGEAAYLVVDLTQEATTEHITCSGRGSCGTTSGTCSCYVGYYPSDGNGNRGTIPDCGSPIAADGSLAVTTTCSVPDCSSHGTCMNYNGVFRCKCYPGYTNPRCTDRTCPRGPAWFDEPTSETVAHVPVECSNAGACNRMTGTCTCRPGFTGAACDRLRCPSEDSSHACSGHGVCLSLREMVKRSSFDGERSGTREIQELTCGLTTGTFTLSINHAESSPIPYDATLSTLKSILEELPGIIAVSVRSLPYTASSICVSPGNVPVTTEIVFTEQDEDIPLLELDYNPAHGSMTITEITKGNMVTYGSNVDNPATWDADSIYGCHCDGTPYWNATDKTNGDASRWYGSMCNLRRCAMGSDPLITLSPGIPKLSSEVQSLFCQADDGMFRLKFRGHTTVYINYNDNEQTVQSKLENLPSIGRVSVTMDLPGKVCSYMGTTTSIQFRTELGDVPEFIMDKYYMPTGSILTVTEDVKGASDNVVECAGRGKCDTGSGLCTCFSGWYSSNGTGFPGSRGDCGHYDVTGYKPEI